MNAVGADHDARPLSHPRTALAVAADAGDGAALPEQVIDDEVLAQFSACLDGGPGEHVVERVAARAERVVDRAEARHARERDAPALDRDPLDRLRAGGDHAVQQTPPLQRGDTGLVDVVRGDRVAGKAVAVHEQDGVALARQEHSRRRPGDPRAHHDCINHTDTLSKGCGGMRRPAHAAGICAGAASSFTGAGVASPQTRRPVS